MDSTPLRAGPDPIRQFARTELGWFVVQKRNQIVALDTRVSDTPLQLSNSTAALTSSPDERYLAWLAGDSLTILDSRIHGVATLRLPSTPELPCVAFGTGAFLHYCRTTEEIATVDVSRLEYVRFTMTPKTSTEANPQ